MVRQMSDKERLRGHIMEQLVEGQLRQKEAACRMGISVRQVKRLFRVYLDQGIDGLISKKRGKPSNHVFPASVMQEAMVLIGSRYADFGPTLATEKLSEQHSIQCSIETVRKNMILAGYWKPKRGRNIQSHPMRERRKRRGELIQIDGSPHDWFEGRAPNCCLLVFIDDATSELMELRFVDTETTLDYMSVLEQYIGHHGLPVALYSDRHSIFRINAKEAHSEAQTQFSRALAQLGISGIQANSPQAKGRVERANQTLQDRLVKEMRLNKINDQVTANAWLPTFMADFNRRFAVAPACSEDAHVAYLEEQNKLKQILCVQSERTLSKNLSCQFNNTLLQVKTQGPGLSLRKAKVTVCEHSDGSITLWWKKRPLPFSCMQKQAKQHPPADGKTVNTLVDVALRKNSKIIPDRHHPWKKTIHQTLEKQSGIYAQFEQHEQNLYSQDVPLLTDLPTAANVHGPVNDHARRRG